MGELTPREDWYSTYDVDEKGMCHNEKPKTMEQVYEYAVKELRKHNEPDDKWSYGPIDEYFNIVHSDGRTHWPATYHWLAIFAVKGGSEGYYIHVEAITGDKRELLLLGKAFGGLDVALEAVKILAHAMEV